MSDLSLKDLQSRMFMAWCLAELKGVKEPDSFAIGAGERSFVHKMLSKKMEVFETGINVPVYLSVILELGLSGNPGLVQIVLAEIIMGCHISSLPYTITPDDFTRTFPLLFPCSDDVGFMEEYEKKWDAQKCERANPGEGDNRVDIPQYWEDIVQHAMRYANLGKREAGHDEG